MHDSVRVRGRQSGGELLGVADALADRERTAAQKLAQRRSFEQLGNDVRLAVVHADVVHVEDVRVLQGCGGTRLERETAELLVAVRSGSQQLDGDLAA